MKANFGAAQCKYPCCDLRSTRGAAEEIPVNSPDAQHAETVLALSETKGRDPPSLGLPS